MYILDSSGKNIEVYPTAKYHIMCEMCHNDFFCTELNHNTRGFLCDACYNSLVRCYDCGEMVRFEDVDGNCCLSCTSNKIIKNYNCRTQRYLGYCSYVGKEIVCAPTPTPKTLYYGIEFEVQIRAKEEDPADEFGEDIDEDNPRPSSELRTILAKNCWQKFGKDFAIIKHDGSIGYGFEIVTAPMTLNVCYEKFEPFLQWFRDTKLFRTFKSPQCGIHIHVSRDALSPLQIGKIISFIHAPTNKEFIEVIAQRKSNHYCDWSQDKKTSDVLRASGNKYEALNLNNAHTIEFRIFQSDSRQVNFFKNLEFVQALIDYTKIASISDTRDYSGFMKFVYRNVKDYRNLAAYLTQVAKKTE